jgi:carbamoyl-phosphate synthase large subunit
MQHVEEAGIHSGDSACVLPPHSLGEEMLDQIRAQASGIARALGVVGLLNVQFAIHASEGLHVIEANPRASRTVPFVSKAIGLPVAKLACRIMLGEKLADMGLPDEVATGHVCVKEAVLPFDRFAGTDVLLGPEMRSTGEVMGIARDFPTAFAKAQAAAGAQLPTDGTVFLTVADRDKSAATGIAIQLHDLGFKLLATRGTAKALARMGIPSTTINKLSEGSPHVVEAIQRGEGERVVNTPVGTGERRSVRSPRRCTASPRWCRCKSCTPSPRRGESALSEPSTNGSLERAQMGRDMHTYICRQLRTHGAVRVTYQAAFVVLHFERCDPSIRPINRLQTCLIVGTMLDNAQA